jgi:putative toxin-antitoxin system antitoxin component (TIGR02293 family)
MTVPERRSASPADRDLIRFRESRSESGVGPPHAYVTLAGLRTFDTAALVRKVEEGLPFRAFEHLQRNLELSSTELGEVLGIRPRTMTRRKEQGRLQPDESDRLLRLSRLFGRALELFESDAPAARGWLRSPQPALGGAVPLKLARTGLGEREVEALIGRLEHGVLP